MNSLVMLLVLIALGLVVLGSGRFRGIRLASRLLSFVGLVFFGLVTLASLYGMFALGDKGGGALLFIAVPAGIITGLFCFAFTSSLGTEAFVALPLQEQLEQTRAGVDEEILRLERRLAEAEAKCHRFWIASTTRERLRSEIERDRLLLDRLRTLQAAIRDPAPASVPGADAPGSASAP